MAKNRLHFAVVVGINRYPALRNLRLAKDDAKKFALWLQDPQGGGLLSEGDADCLVPGGHVTTIALDEPAESESESAGVSGLVSTSQPVAATIQEVRPIRREVCQAIHKYRVAIEEYVKLQPGDWKKSRFYFYVSGHGIAPDARDAALLLADAGPESYDENISCDRLLSFLGKRQPFREVVIFADCCRERVNNVPLGAVSGTLADKQNGKIVTAFCCATYFGDLAYEPPPAEKPDEQRGYFTQALLEGLRGEAAEPQGVGEINSNTLAKYIKQRVRDLTKTRKSPQDPRMDCDPAEPIVFRAPAAGGVPADSKHEIRVEFATPFRGKVELRDTNNAILREHRTEDGDLVVQLANGLYEVTPEQGSSVEFLGGGRFRVHGDNKHVRI